MARLYDLNGKNIWVAGHGGMVGAAVCRRLEAYDCTLHTKPRAELDLTRQAQVEEWLADTDIDAIFLCAARVGGILANSTYPAEFIYDNLMIEANIIHAAYRAGVAKLVFLGSSCIYPKHATQPIAETALLEGALEPTNEMYAIAKIAGLKLCQAYRQQYGADFIAAMPTNLYGPHDDFDLETSHVVPALLRKAHTAKMDNAPAMVIWGTGSPLREFLHVDDCADALVFLAEHYSDRAPVNIGAGRDCSIADLARLICDVVGFDGALEFDDSKPDGTPRKLLDVTRMAQLGWTAKIALRDGLATTYDWYQQHAL